MCPRSQHTSISLNSFPHPLATTISHLEGVSNNQLIALFSKEEGIGMPIAPKAAEGSQEAASLEPLAVNKAVNKIIGVHKNKADRYEVSTQG